MILSPMARMLIGRDSIITISLLSSLLEIAPGCETGTVAGNVSWSTVNTDLSPRMYSAILWMSSS